MTRTEGIQRRDARTRRREDKLNRQGFGEKLREFAGHEQVALVPHLVASFQEIQIPVQVDDCPANIAIHGLAGGVAELIRIAESFCRFASGVLLLRILFAEVLARVFFFLSGIVTIFEAKGQVDGGVVPTVFPPAIRR